MPTYSFNCESCEKSFDSYLTMSKSDQPLGEPCPECGELDSVKKAYTSAPSMGIDHNHKVDKPQGGQFQERMAHILDNAPGIDREARQNLERHTTR